MSYILDALQRADAERTRGSVPGLHARPMATPMPLQTTHTKTGLWLALSGIVLLGTLCAGLWWWLRPANGPATALATPATPPQATGPASAQAVAAVTNTSVSTAPLAAQKSSTSLAARPASVPAKTLLEPPHMASQAVPAKAPAAPRPAPAPQATPAPANIPLLSELPENIRSQIPALRITGAVYSENPAQRLLLVNGLVLNQGGTIRPDLTVVEIRSTSSDFVFKGTRFRMMH